MASLTTKELRLHERAKKYNGQYVKINLNFNEVPINYPDDIARL